MWREPLSSLILSNKDVHVWYAPVKETANRLHYLKHILSTDELQRANRFNFETDRNRFITAHGILRTILGHYLNISADKLHFSYGRYGKPTLVDNISQKIVHFNVSHSSGLVLYAITRYSEVGIDIERIRPIDHMDQIAECYFSEQEKTAFRSLPENQKQEAFFAYWTRKEAFIKATGRGLSYPLNTFTVSLAPGLSSINIITHDNRLERSNWSLRELQPGPGYIAAVAAKGYDWNFQCRQWI